MNSRILYEIAGFLLGLLFGSFLNVCISRLPWHESIIHPRSRCPECGAAIRWYDNIPLLSWLLLGRRCRDCHQTIPPRYPLVELAVGIWFAVQAARLHTLLSFYFWKPSGVGTTSDAVSGIIVNVAVTILGFLLIGLIVMDWQTQLLPDAFTLTGIAAGLFLICTQAIFLGPNEGQVLLTRQSIHLSSPGGVSDRGNVFLTGPEALIGGRVLAVCCAALLLLLVRWLYHALRRREGMGLGDVKLFAMIASLLGFWPAVLALFAGVLTASVYGVVLMVRGKAALATKLAFGSFLAAGGLFAAQFGDRIIESYSVLMR
ncbi:prepilin peptidase [Edaphobacter bradus]|uniref:prepilin peptidase n=1 Tax=Edaphobacter bradus TaxID=2259016 RepID=UPI0021DF64C2|nr:A24 family peptidase [Edaphobacter bradus]